VAAERFGKYILLRKIATGGMAEIFLARQTGVEGFEKLVVIKRILPHLSENEEFINMFLDEARIAAQLNHPHIVQIFDLGKVEGSYFITMEYVHGDDLSQIVKQGQKVGRPLPMDHTVKIIAMTCEGLHYAHTKSDIMGRALHIVHRDISPQNILVTYEGSAKLVDFGIAKAASQAGQTRAGVLKGKFAYMSPEQILGEELDGRSDIFAIGIILYELSVGRRLFKRDSEPEIMRAITEGQVPPPHKINPDVPPELEAVIMRALATNRDERYPDARRMQMDLERLFRQGIFNSSTIHVSNYMKKIFHDKLKKQQEMLEKAQVESLDQLLLKEDEGGGQSEYDDFFSPEQDAQQRGLGLDDGGRGAQRRSTQGLNLEPVAGLVPPASPPDPGGRVPHRRERPTGPDMGAQPVRRPSQAAMRAAGAKFEPGESVRSGLELDLEAKPAAPRHTPDPVRAPSTISTASSASRLTPSYSGLHSRSGVRVARLSPSGGKRGLMWATVLILALATIGAVALFWDTISKGLGTSSPIVEWGTIRVVSRPSGASVNIDGVEYPQRTPATIERVSLNDTHYVKISKPGYFPEVKECRVTEERPTHVIEVALPPDRGTKGRIRVTTRPAGAAVILDGRRHSKRTPCTISRIDLGVVHKIRVEKRGYKSAADEFSVDDAKKVMKLRFNLSPSGASSRAPAIEQAAMIAVVSDPSGARVLIDGDPTGDKTPVKNLEVPAGKKVSVALKLDGYHGWSTQVIVPAGKKRALEAKLNRKVGAVTPIKRGKPGFLSITVEPPCDVYIDGKGIGISPIASHPVPPGSHNVRIVSRKDWLDRSYKVFIESEKSVERSFTFRQGKLTFVALPGTEIFIGKRKLGQTPMPPVALYEGEYLFRVVDSQLGKEKMQRETVVAGKAKMVDVDLR